MISAETAGTVMTVRHGAGETAGTVMTVRHGAGETAGVYMRQLRFAGIYNISLFIY